MGFGFVLSDPLVNHMIIEKSHAQVRARNLCYLSMAIFLGQFLSSFIDFILLMVNTLALLFCEFSRPSRQAEPLYLENFISQATRSIFWLKRMQKTRWPSVTI